MRLALLALQLGAIAVVLAASPRITFDLDRFLVPKEFVLHLTAVLAAALLWRRIKLESWIDWLLLAYLALGVLSALLATNKWLGIRALAVSASGIAIFWAARALADAGLEQKLLNAIAFAVVLAAVTSLLQAYGVRIDLFAENRAPGGTLGNRNFVAHAAAFGLPVCVLAAMRARRFLFPSIGVAIVAASLVLTRSRAAWLAAAAMFAVLLVSRLPWRRLAVLVLLAGAGVAAALLVPNALRWRSDNPYLDSVRDVANYKEGSGRGRLVQYERSLRIAARSPIFGVGPGNWTVAYPAHVPASDPSLDTSVAGMTANPWPSSDWVAFASERGFLAALLMVLVFLGIAWQSREPVVLATLAAVTVAGAFDAVLLLAMPTFIVWATLGALSLRRAESPPLHRNVMGAVAVVFVIALSAIGAARSAAQLVSMEVFATTWDRAALERASRIDPGNYRLHLRLARTGKRAQRCEHARAAHALCPNAGPAKELARRCE